MTKKNNNISDFNNNKASNLITTSAIENKLKIKSYTIIAAMISYYYT